MVRFSLTIDGVEIGQFSELINIYSEVESIEMRQSGSDGTISIKTLPGKRKPPTVTLRRGLTMDLSMAAWHESVVGGDVAAARRNAVLTMFAANGDPVARYHLEAAWPSKLEVGPVDGGGPGSNLHETVTLTCEDIQRVAP